MHASLFNTAYPSSNGLNPFDLKYYLKAAVSCSNIDIKKIDTGELRIRFGSKIYNALLFIKEHISHYPLIFFLWKEKTLMSLLEKFRPLTPNLEINVQHLLRNRDLGDAINTYTEKVEKHFMEAIKKSAIFSTTTLAIIERQPNENAATPEINGTHDEKIAVPAKDSLSL